MKLANTAIPVLVLILSTFGSIAPWPAQAPAQDDFRWMTNLDAAMRLAADSGRPLLIVFR